jgi:hypothetical protein
MTELFYSDFTGGFNDTTPSSNLKDNELVVCENAFPHPRGGIEKRKGCTKYVPYEIRSDYDDRLIEFLHSDGSSYLLCIEDGILKIVEELSAFYLPYSGIDFMHKVLAIVQYMDRLYFTFEHVYYVGDSMTPVYTYHYAVYGHWHYATNEGTKTLYEKDIVKNIGNNTGAIGHYYLYDKTVSASINLGTTNFADTSTWMDVTHKSIPAYPSYVASYSDSTNNLEPIKKCRFMVLHQPSKRFFAAGNPDDPGALYFSEIDKPNYFKATSKVYPTNAAGPITGLICADESIFVSYKRCWYAYTGIFPGIDAVWKPLNIPVGAVNDRAICLTPRSITFVSEKDIWIMNPLSLRNDYVKVPTDDEFLNLSDTRIRNTMETIKKPELIRIIYHDNKVFIAYNDSDTGVSCNKVLVLDWDTKSFVKITGWDVSSLCSRYNGDLLFYSRYYSSIQHRYVFSILKGFSSYSDYDLAADVEIPIDFKIVTKLYALDTYRNKILSLLYIDAKRYIENTVNSCFDINLESESFDEYLVASILDKYYTNNHNLEYQNYVAKVDHSGFKFQININDNNASNTINPIFIYTIGFIFNVLNNIADAANLDQTPLISD